MASMSLVCINGAIKKNPPPKKKEKKKKIAANLYFFVSIKIARNLPE